MSLKSKITLPKIKGITIKKLNLAAFSLSIPNRADVDIVAGNVATAAACEAEAAKACAINLLAQVKAACGGDLDRLVRVVKLTGFVNSTPDYTEQPQVINGASNFLAEALGEAGRHARSAVSAAALPLGIAVEIEGIFQIK